MTVWKTIALGACACATAGALLHAQASSTPTAALAPAEQALVASVRDGNAVGLALLERVVNINSGTQNLAGVRNVGNVFRAEFDALGFQTEWVDGAAWKRAGHLVARHPGDGRGPRLLLIGHLDTVFEPDSPFQTFTRVGDHEATGPGIIDMKGGDVVIVQALRALKAAGVLAPMNITVVMTGDEEAPGRPLAVARKALVDAARGVDVAIGFEDGPGDPRYAVTARRGTTSWRLAVTGQAAHSSQIFRDEVGYGAIYELSRILNGFRDKLAGEEHLTFNPGIIAGGTAVDLDPVQVRATVAGKDNIVAAQAQAVGDLRALTNEQFARAKKTMTEVATAGLPRTTASLTFDEGYPPLAPTDGNTKLLAAYDLASRDVGAGPVAAVNPDKAGAADVSFVAGEVKMILDGVGLMGHDDHTPKETADLSTLPTQTMRAAVTIYRITRQPR